MNHIKWGFILLASWIIALAVLVTAFARWESCEALSCGSIPQETVVKWELYEWSNDDEIVRLLREAELPKDYSVQNLHSKICKTTEKSPLCEDIEILRRIDSIAREKWVPTGLIIGIMFAESTLATNYNKPACAHYNNPFGIKGRKYDTGKVEWYTKTKGRADSNWCWLYKFDSIDEATYSLANTISIGYKACNNSVRCLAYSYVWHPEVAEESWMNRVNKFAIISQ